MSDDCVRGVDEWQWLIIRSHCAGGREANLIFPNHEKNPANKPKNKTQTRKKK